MLLLILINPTLPLAPQIILQSLCVLTIGSLMFSSINVLIKSSYSLSRLMRAIFISYYSFFKRVLCPKREQVVLRYYLNRKYVTHVFLIFFELLMVMGHLADLYNTTPDMFSTMYLGQIGFFTICTIYNLKTNEQKGNT